MAKRRSKAKPISTFTISADDIASVADTAELKELMIQKANQIVNLAKAEFERSEVAEGVRPDEKRPGVPNYPDAYSVEVVRSLDGADRVIGGPSRKLPMVRVRAGAYTSHWLERKGTYGSSRIDYRTLRDAIDQLELGDS